MGKERSAPGRRRGRARAAAAALIAFGALACARASAQDFLAEPLPNPSSLPEPLVYLRDIDTSILQDMRYAGPDNFTGRRLPGYEAGECVLLREAAEALARVQQALLPRGLSLKVYDCYRPRRAVRAFVSWIEGARAPADPLLKRFHPNIDRSQLIAEGYVAAISHHSRGDTVDLTLVKLAGNPAVPFSRQAAYGPCTGPARDRAPDNGVDMGTGFDCFDARSHTAASDITAAQARWRRTLVEAMARQGFRNYRKEWWHFTFVPARAARSFNASIVARPP
ncbi:MAG TPA: M15 family metallopeptidase [Hyphomicrobiaceae bacterium]|jgi:D-alanyl-D-alanine dipeptidase